jgi:pimeloyl-ACP methyl ester carboxylesterase
VPWGAATASDITEPAPPEEVSLMAKKRKVPRQLRARHRDPRAGAPYPEADVIELVPTETELAPANDDEAQEVTEPIMPATAKAMVAALGAADPGGPGNDGDAGSADSPVPEVVAAPQPAPAQRAQIDDDESAEAVAGPTEPGEAADEQFDDDVVIVPGTRFAIDDGDDAVEPPVGSQDQATVAESAIVDTPDESVEADGGSGEVVETAKTETANVADAAAETAAAGVEVDGGSGEVVETAETETANVADAVAEAAEDAGSHAATADVVGEIAPLESGAEPTAATRAVAPEASEAVGSDAEAVAKSDAETASESPRKHRGGLIALIVVLVVVLVAAGLTFFGQRGLIYSPDTADPGPIAARNVPGSDVQFTTDDGLTLHGWLLTPTGNDRHTAVLFLNGNGGNRANRLGIGSALAAEGFTVLLFDYRGYGGNPGSPTEQGLDSDARAAAAFLRGQGFAGDDTIYVGESLGTVVATQLAVSDPPAGLVLRSPFPELADVAHVEFGWAPTGLLNVLLRDKYNTMAPLSQVTVPVTVLSGGADTVVPQALTAQVVAAVPHLFQSIVRNSADHNSADWNGPYLADRVAALANSVIG